MKKKLISIFFILLSMALIGIGIYMKQPQSVWTKAITICLECVGIG
ncbi:MAG: CD1871A family CXXC motif-containing protein [Lachnospiraceae bacterium]